MFFLVLLLISCSTISEAGKSDVNIINKIREKFWNNGNCVPRDLLRTGAFMSPAAVARTTTDFYPDEKNVLCILSVFKGSSIKLYTQYANGSRSNQPSTVINMVEKNGVLNAPATGAYMYHLYSNRYGVSVLYKCFRKGKSGVHQGLIKVSLNGYDSQAVIEAIRDLASLGIKVSDKKFDVTCKL